MLSERRQPTLCCEFHEFCPPFEVHFFRDRCDVIFNRLRRSVNVLRDFVRAHTERSQVQHFHFTPTQFFELVQVWRRDHVNWPKRHFSRVMRHCSGDHDKESFFASPLWVQSPNCRQISMVLPDLKVPTRFAAVPDLKHPGFALIRHLWRHEIVHRCSDELLRTAFAHAGVFRIAPEKPHVHIPRQCAHPRIPIERLEHVRRAVCDRRS